MNAELEVFPDRSDPLVQEDRWELRGLCRQVDSELFYPEKGQSTREAKLVCSGCPVRSACLEFALSSDQRFGVWGGLSEKELRRLKARPVVSLTDLDGAA